MSVIVSSEVPVCSSLLNHACVNTCVHSVVCIEVGVWVYLRVNILVQTQRCGQVREVLHVSKVKLLREG